MKSLGDLGKKFLSSLRDSSVLLVSQFDADGLTAGSILAKALLREGKDIEWRIVKQLIRFELEKLSKKEVILTVDCGSGQLEELKKFFPESMLILVDHHLTSFKKIEEDNLLHLNSRIILEKELSASILAFLLAKNMNKRNSDLVDLALVGFIGDRGYKDIEEVKWIIEEGIKMGKISKMFGIRIFGRSFRPIHKALVLSFNPFIPGISGSESNAIQLLSELNIKVKENGNWRRLKDLEIEEQKRLATALVMERIKSENLIPEDIFGEMILLNDNPEEIEEASEFSTLLNACARMDRPDLSIRLCLKDFSVLSQAFEAYEQYRRSLAKALELIKQEQVEVIKKEKNGIKVCWVVGRKKIKESLVGTLASILISSNFADLVFVFGEGENYTKVSARKNSKVLVNLKELVSKASDSLGEAGGHENAAGAFIEKGKEFEFIENLNKFLENG